MGRGRPKGIPKTGGRQKGTRNKETLLKEERRAIFDNKVSQKWEEIINKLPPTYIADQFLGKATEKIEFEGKIGLDVNIKSAIEKIYGGEGNKTG